MRWADQSSDTQPRKLQEFISEVSFIDAFVVLRQLTRCSQIIVAEICRQGIATHLKGGQTELGGILIGRAFSADNSFGGIYGKHVILLEDFVPSEDYETTGVSLTMGTEVWNRVRESLGNRMVVGWYHSHPNLGAFFSGTDRRTQRHFFREAYSVGLVIDPIRDEEAWFLGPEAAPLSSSPLKLSNTAS
jgi:hypothetical protein